MQWTDQDQTAALAQGWGVFAIWEQQDERVLYEILRADNSDIYPTDHAARVAVQARALAAARDPLCWRAWQLVFHSRLGVG